jgi:hypothetical protein
MHWKKGICNLLLQFEIEKLMHNSEKLSFVVKKHWMYNYLIWILVLLFASLTNRLSRQHFGLIYFARIPYVDISLQQEVDEL